MLSTDCLELPRLSSVRLSSRETSDSLPCRPKVLLRSLLWGCVSDLFANACSRLAHSRATLGSTPPAEVWPRASSASTCNLKPASMDRGASPPSVISCCIVRQPRGARASVLTVCPTPARAKVLRRELGAVLRVDRRGRRRRGAALRLPQTGAVRYGTPRARASVGAAPSPARLSHRGVTGSR